ncbi:MAG: hypothetical protein MZU97_06095 [Bacillus subtilis]|nr:hypothetical protein [Bacillus subtilis]
MDPIVSSNASATNGLAIATWRFDISNPEPLEVEDPDVFMAEYVKERPDQVIASLPWDRAEVFSVTRLRFTLTIEEFFDCPWFAKAVEIEDIDENTVMPAAFRAVVDLEIDKADGHLIVTAIATDLINQRWSYECGDTGISGFRMQAFDPTDDGPVRMALSFGARTWNRRSETPRIQGSPSRKSNTDSRQFACRCRVRKTIDSLSGLLSTILV